MSDNYVRNIIITWYNICILYLNVWQLRTTLYYHLMQDVHIVTKSDNYIQNDIISWYKMCTMYPKRWRAKLYKMCTMYPKVWQLHTKFYDQLIQVVHTVSQSLTSTYETFLLKLIQYVCNTTMVFYITSKYTYPHLWI